MIGRKEIREKTHFSFSYLLFSMSVCVCVVSTFPRYHPVRSVTVPNRLVTFPREDTIEY